MAKFCGNCGYQSDDTAVVCGNCGTPLEGAAPAPAAKMDPKFIKLGAIALAAIAVVVVLIIVFAGGGYKSAVGDVFDAYIENEPSILVDLTPDYQFEMGAKESDIKDSYKKAIESQQEWWEEKTDKDYEVSYTITDTDEYSEEKMEDAIDEIEKSIDAYEKATGKDVDFDTELIDEAMEVELDIVVEEGDEVYEYDGEIVLIKIDGNWKVVDIDI
ncbi:MAG: zinc ribbon domain-containing protein [Clostridia bacterium]|nr:zinc ribbon domain-containing protein [Clostridia bacterium]